MTIGELRALPIGRGQIGKVKYLPVGGAGGRGRPGRSNLTIPASVIKTGVKLPQLALQPATADNKVTEIYDFIM